MDKELIQIDFERMQGESGAAWLLVVDGEEIWFPKSICMMDSDSRIKAIHVPEWLAIEKGLE